MQPLCAVLSWRRQAFSCSDLHFTIANLPWCTVRFKRDHQALLTLLPGMLSTATRMPIGRQHPFNSSLPPPRPASLIFTCIPAGDRLTTKIDISRAHLNCPPLAGLPAAHCHEPVGDKTGSCKTHCSSLGLPFLPSLCLPVGHSLTACRCCLQGRTCRFHDLQAHAKCLPSAGLLTARTLQGRAALKLCNHKLHFILPPLKLTPCMDGPLICRYMPA